MVPSEAGGDNPRTGSSRFLRTIGTGRGASAASGICGPRCWGCGGSCDPWRWGCGVVAFGAVAASRVFAIIVKRAMASSSAWPMVMPDSGCGLGAAGDRRHGALPSTRTAAAARNASRSARLMSTRRPGRVAGSLPRRIQPRTLESGARVIAATSSSVRKSMTPIRRGDYAIVDNRIQRGPTMCRSSRSLTNYQHQPIATGASAVPYAASHSRTLCRDPGRSKLPGTPWSLPSRIYRKLRTPNPRTMPTIGWPVPQPDRRDPVDHPAARGCRGASSDHRPHRARFAASAAAALGEPGGPVGIRVEIYYRSGGVRLALASHATIISRTRARKEPA